VSLNKKAFVDVVERVFSTAVQAAVGVAAGFSTSIANGTIDYRSALVAVGVAAAVSVLKNLQSLFHKVPGVTDDEKKLGDAVEAAVEARLNQLTDKSSGAKN